MDGPAAFGWPRAGRPPKVRQTARLAAAIATEDCASRREGDGEHTAKEAAVLDGHFQEGGRGGPLVGWRAGILRRMFVVSVVTPHDALDDVGTVAHEGGGRPSLPNRSSIL